ncbi:MAG: PKD domain-containing protein [Bacteroidota bacterium]
MKKLLQIFTVVLSMNFLAENSNAQFIIGNDTTVCSIPFTLQSGGNTGSGGTATYLDCSNFIGCDDGYCITPINLGFSFTFYGNTYTQCVFGSNGVVNFDISLAGTYCQWPISNAIPSSSNPTNAIMFPWQDIYYPAAAGNTAFMSYATYGTAPNRYAVFDMCFVPMFSCNSLLTSQQVILYETTNIIEMHITNKPLCATWNSGAGIEGIQNSTGTSADWVSGRNYPTQWSTSNDGYRFTPNGGTYTVTSIPYAPVPMNAANVIGWYENGILIGNGNSISVNPPVGTTQYVAIANTCGGPANDTMLLTYDPLTLSETKINPTCANAANGSITATAAGTAPYTYIWKDSTGAVLQTDANVSGPATLSNLYMGPYSVTVIGSLGCQIQHFDTLTAAFFQAAFISTPTGYCQYKDLQFQDQSIGVTPIGWGWDFGDGTYSVSQNPTHLYVDSGLFDVSMIIMVPGGCSDTVTNTIQVWPAPIAAWSVSPLTICVNQQLTFSDHSSYYPKQWDWNFGDTSTANGTGSTSTHSYYQAGMYTVTLVETDSLCGNDTSVGFINVNAYPITNIGNDTAVCKGTQLVLDAGIPNMVYLWSTGATSQKITVTPQKATEYNVTLNNHGCVYNDAIEIGILCELYIPNAFSPNRDGTNDVFMTFGTEVTEVHIRIYNRWGQLVYSGDDLKKGWNGYMGTQEAAVGVYTYDIKATFINNETKEYKGNLTLLR